MFFEEPQKEIPRKTEVWLWKREEQKWELYYRKGDEKVVHL